MADLYQNIDLIKLKESYKWCVARKGFGLSPKEKKSGLGCGKEDGCRWEQGVASFIGVAMA
jgi:hypothetical protein